jgi:hypothetical protein
LLTTSERASGSEPTTAASSADGFSGFMNAEFGLLPGVLAMVFLQFRNVPKTAKRLGPSGGMYPIP